MLTKEQRDRLSVVRDESAGGVCTGDTFYDLTAIEPFRAPFGVLNHLRWYWKCRCSCGAIVDVVVGNLRSGNTKSCGCKKAERIAKARSVHGHNKRGASSREYNSWASMKARCENPTNHKYRIYGARGISICDRWKESFVAFLEDMGQRPPGTSLDRIDVDGNYEPGNCRWADPKTQTSNRRAPRHV